MKLVTFKLVTLALFLPLCSPVAGADHPSPVYPVTADVFLDAVAQVESGGSDWAIGKRGERGRYQFTEDTWKMHTTVDFHFAHDRLMADLVAREHFRYLYSEFEKRGWAPTPYNLAACWNAGLTGGGRRPLPPHVDDYAQRVANICLSR